MSQFGMQMPGGRARKSDSMNVYSALMFIAFVSLAVACGVMWQAGTSVAKDGNPLTGLQDPARISFPGMPGAR
jgi:hypothetical protein